MGTVNIDEISLKFTATAGNVSNTFAALERRLEQIGKAFDRIDTSKVDRICNAFENLANSVTADTGKAMRGMASMFNSLKQFDSSAATNAASSIDTIGQSLRSFPVMSPEQAKNLSSVATALNAFSRVKNMGDIGDVRAFTANIRELFTSMQGLDVGRIQPVAEAISKFAQGINILGRTKVDKAITNLPLLAKEMENLMNSLARAPTVSDNVIRMTEAMAQLASQGQKVGSATASLNRNLNGTNSAGRSGAKGLDIFSRSASAQKAHIKSLASIVGGLIAKYWILWRAIQMLGDMAGVASSLVEVQNVVDHTFGQMSNKLDEFTKSSIDNFGLSTLAAKQYASRFQSMGMAMGITNNQVAQSADFVSAHMTDEAKALYNTSDSLADMSINLTKLAADYASFYDIDPSEAFEKMQSIYTGSTRPLRSLGLDISQTNLKEWALTNGINANIEAMTQSEKAMLRYQYIMAQSNHILSDFSRTSDTYHNTLTKLKANFQTLKGTIGTSLMNLFKPIMVVVNNAIVVINQFAKAVGDSLGKILGWRYEVGNGAVALEDTADYMDDVGSSAGGASKAAKELKRQLQGFDELNLLTTDPDKGGSGGGGGGSGLGGAGGASNLAGQWVKDEGLFESDWDTWFKLGRGISEAWTQGLNSIDWDEVYQNFSDFGSGLAQFLNGLITPDLFGALGQTIAGALNSAFHFLDSFGTTFDWNNFGKSIAEGINKFFTTFDFKLAASAIHNIAGGILDAAIAAVEGVDWTKVGQSISDFIGGLDLPDLVSKLSQLAVDVISALAEAIRGVDFKEIGKAIGGVISSIDFIELGISLLDLASSILKAIGEGIKGLVDSGHPIAAALCSIFVLTKLTGLATTLGELGKSIGIKIAGNIMTDNVKGSIASSLSTAFSKTGMIYLAIATAIGGWELGNLIYDQLPKDKNGDNAIDRTVSNVAEVVTNIFNPDEQSKKYTKEHPFGEIGEIAGQVGQELSRVFGTSSKKIKKCKDMAILYNGSLKTLTGTEKELTVETNKSNDSNESNAKSLDITSQSAVQLSGALAQTARTTDSMASTGAQNVNNMRSVFISNADLMKTNWSINMLGMKTESEKQTSSIYQSTSKWSEEIKKLVSNTKANATFGVTTTPKQTISDAMNNLKSAWTGKNVNFTVNPNATGKNTISSAYTERANLWNNKGVNFTVNPYATSVWDVVNANAERHAQWYDKTANLWMNPNVTSKQSIDDAYNSLTSGWSDKTANLSIGMSIDSVSGSIDDIKKEARNAAVDKFNDGVTQLENVLRNKKVITHNEQLPRLNRVMATGGIVDKATIAMIGEAGTEAVVPLEHNTEWLGKMADMLATEMSYSAPAYTSGSYTANTSGARSEQDIAEQNALLREQNRLLQIIANKDVTISSSDVFNATMDEGENYYHKTGNSPFIF